MSRIDDIRNSLKTGDYQVSILHQDGSATLANNAHIDIEYLLSKLEIAVKALEQLDSLIDERPDCYPLYGIAYGALEKIK